MPTDTNAKPTPPSSRNEADKKPTNRDPDNETPTPTPGDETGHQREPGYDEA